MINGVLGNYDDFKKTILGDTNMNEKEKETIVKATRKKVGDSEVTKQSITTAGC